MTDVLAVANQKGGVAKTTTVHSLGVASAELGRRTLVVDLDPQACLTFSLGFDPDALDRSLHDVFVRRDSVAEVTLPVPGVDFLDLLPASIDLAGSEVHLLTRTGREHVLERALEPVLAQYDLVLIDCPPSLGVLTINGLTAANAVVIPLQCEALSHRGVGQLLETIEDVRAFANSELERAGHRGHHVRRPHQALAAHHRRGRGPLRDSRPPASGAQVDPVRRGAGAGEVDPPARPELARSDGLSTAGSDPGRRNRRRRHRWLVPEGPDPLGKRALYWMPIDQQALSDDDEGPTAHRAKVAPGHPTPATRHARPAGKHALFSEATPSGEPSAATSTATATDPLPPHGLLSVGCSSCGSISRVGVIEFVLLQFPVRRLAPPAHLRPVDDLPRLPAADVDQCDPVPVVLRAERAQRSDPPRVRWVP